MKTIDIHKLKRMLLQVADEIVEYEPYLTEIDTLIGDADHGTGMKRGFESVRRMLRESEFETIRELLKTVGVELVKTMGGASGVIFGTLFIGGLSKLNDGDTVSLTELAVYFDEGAEAIQRRGKARAGQKTMLDALLPAVEALKQSADSGTDMEEALKKAYEMALKGVEASKMMQSKIGRSKNFQEATIGFPDPGAISTSLIFKALHDGINLPD